MQDKLKIGTFAGVGHPKGHVHVRAEWGERASGGDHLTAVPLRRTRRD